MHSARPPPRTFPVCSRSPDRRYGARTVSGSRRLTPQMASRKLLALDFVKQYFARWGGSPSLDEIAAALGVSKQRASELVRALAEDGQILRTPGARRGLDLPEPAQTPSRADLLLMLSDQGWTLTDDGLLIAPEADRVEPAALTKAGLTLVPELDHVAPDDTGDGTGAGDEGADGGNGGV